MQLTVNNRPHTWDGDPGRSLLDFLRDDLGITSPKDGCAPQAACGCCTVGSEARDRLTEALHKHYSIGNTYRRNSMQGNTLPTT